MNRKSSLLLSKIRLLFITTTWDCSDIRYRTFNRNNISIDYNIKRGTKLNHFNNFTSPCLRVINTAQRRKENKWKTQSWKIAHNSTTVDIFMVNIYIILTVLICFKPKAVAAVPFTRRQAKS